MIRNYNGNVNHKVLRDLERLCAVHSKNRKNLMDEFAAKGEIAFYINNNPLTNGLDVFSKESLKSEEEIAEILKEDLKERLTEYLKGKDTKDYLLSTLIEFIKKSNGTFPNTDEMREIQKDAEAKRVADLPADKEPIKRNRIQYIALEILQLSEEIMESRRRSNPEDIFTPVEPYSERMIMTFGKFTAGIYRECYYGHNDYRDYRLLLCENRELKTKIFYDSQGNPVIDAKEFEEEEFDISTIEYLTLIHKNIAAIARNEGIEFKTEIYSKEVLSS